MKRLFFLLLLFVAASTAGFAQKKRVAIVTFYVDKYINADKIEEASRQSTYEMTQKDDPRFDLRPELQGFHETFIKEYIKDFPFEIVPEEEIFQSPQIHRLFRTGWRGR